MTPDLTTWSTEDLRAALDAAPAEWQARTAAYNQMHTEYVDFCQTVLIADAADIPVEHDQTTAVFIQKTENLNAAHQNITDIVQIQRSLYAELYRRSEA